MLKIVQGCQRQLWFERGPSRDMDKHSKSLTKKGLICYKNQYLLNYKFQKLELMEFLNILKKIIPNKTNEEYAII
jgi:hypothetical protein